MTPTLNASICMAEHLTEAAPSLHARRVSNGLGLCTFCRGWGAKVDAWTVPMMSNFLGLVILESGVATESIAYQPAFMATTSHSLALESKTFVHSLCKMNDLVFLAQDFNMPYLHKLFECDWGKCAS